MTSIYAKLIFLSLIAVTFPVQPRTAMAQNEAAIVVSVTGDWYCLNKAGHTSPKLKIDDRLEFGSTVRPNENQSGLPKITLVLSTGDCKELTSAMSFPPRESRNTISRIFTIVLGTRRKTWTSAISRSPGVLQDAVVKLDDDRLDLSNAWMTPNSTIDRAKIAKIKIADGTRHAASPEDALSIDLDEEKRQWQTQTQMKPGLYELSFEGTFADSCWILALPPKQFDVAAEIYAEATRQTKKWGKEQQTSFATQFHRACLAGLVPKSE